MKTKDDKRTPAPRAHAPVEALDAIDGPLPDEVLASESSVDAEKPPAPVPVVWPSDVPAPPPPVKRYRVLSQRTLSIHGVLITLRPKDVVSVESYGPTAMEAILGSGAELVEVKD